MEIRTKLPNLWIPRDYQKPAWEYLEAGGKHCEMVHHRRAGKDDISLHWTSVSANVLRVGNYWHMLPLQNQARRAIWQAVNPHTGKKRIDEAFPETCRASTNESEMLIKFTNGSTWQVVGSDNYNSLVGSPPIGLVFSEWALCDPAAWAYLMPIVQENGGWVIFNTTPRGRNHAYRSVMGSMKNPDSFGEILSAEHTNVFNKQQLEEIKTHLIETYGEDYGQSVYEQEYLVSFEAALLGAILGRAMAKAESDGRISNEHEYDPDGMPIEISSDIGRRDASTWWYWQPCIDGFRLVDHDRDSGLDAQEWCDRLGKNISDKGYKLGKIHLPHDAKAKTFAARHSAIEIFIHHFGQKLMNIVPDATKTDRINAARQVVRKCSFHRDRTEKGRDGLVNWCFVYDEERREFSKEPDHNWASHDGDGFSYGALIMVEELKKIEEKEVDVAEHAYNNPATLNQLWDEATPNKQKWRI